MGKTLSKQTIVQGAIILTIASIIIRFLAIGYRIPLGRLLGAEGLGIYAIPNQVYLIFFTISSAGIPVGVARLISGKISGGYYRDAYRTFKVAFAAMFVTGLFFSILLFFGASWLVEKGLVKNPQSYYGLLAIAPVIFFAALTSSFRGLFQGLQNMSPVAASQVAEQVVLVIGTVFLSYLLLPRGLALAAAGANFGAVPGAAVATLMMTLYYFRHKGALLEMVERDTSGRRESSLSLLKKILAVSIPISFASVAMAVTGFVDNILIIDRLEFAGYSTQQATAFYGQFNQMAMSFINISIAFAFSLGTSIVPSVAEAYSLQNKKRIATQASSAIRLSLLTTLPAAVGLMAIAPQLTYFIYNDQSAGIALAALAPSIIFWGVHLVLSGVLQGLGKANIPVTNLLVGIACRIAITYFLVPTSLGIRAAALGTVTMFVVSSALNFIAVKRLVGININIPSTVLKPALASLLMGLAVWKAYGWGLALLNHEYLATIAALLVGMVTYPVFALVSGSVRPDDVKSIPRIGLRAASILSSYESHRDKLLSKLSGR
ncbi:MAG: putative polysaccharide biosynthesis protein [Desulfocucumaceae bacterium]